MTHKTVISKDIQFDAGHRISNHESKCRNPHGHRYRVVVRLVGAIIENELSPEYGMLADFGRIKEFLIEYVEEPFDHGFIIDAADEKLEDLLMNEYGWKVTTLPYPPTAENIARYVYNRLVSWTEEHFSDVPLEAKDVTVWETPTCSATYPMES